MPDSTNVWGDAQSARNDGWRTVNSDALGYVARRNAYVFIAILFFMEVFWLVAHRLIMGEGWTFYRVSEFNLTIFVLFIIVAAALSLAGVFFSNHVGIVRRVPINPLLCRAIYAATIVSNLTAAALLADNARYLMGGLTGLAGVVYGISRSLSLMMMVITWKEKYRSGVPIAWVVPFIVSYGMTIDGLAIALTLACYIALLFGELRFKNIPAAAFLGAILVLLFLVGLYSKFDEVPEYFTPWFMTEWVTARMAIASEQAYTYLSGESILNRPGSYLDLLVRSFENRLTVLFGNFSPMNYPRSVSEAFYYDMYNRYEAGSSPGFLLGTIMHGPFSVIIVFLASFLFVQMFYGINHKFSIVQLLFLVYLTKGIHANITEYLVVISPTMLALFLFVIACLLEPQAPRTLAARGSRSIAEGAD